MPEAVSAGMIACTLLLLLATDPTAEERPLPLVPLADFTGTEARALDDYLGQVLLLDFFAHWCAPCARQVPHLNELQDAYGDQGLNVLGVTGDDAPTAVEWLTRLQARYAHARDAELALQIGLGFKPLPSAVLVDATGVIVWQGNPAELPLATLETLLEDALPLPAHRWPSAARPVHAALRARNYAEAERLAKALPERSAEITRFVARLLERRRALLESAFGAQDFLGADELAAEIDAGVADGPLRSRAREVRAAIAAAEEARTVLGAQRELRELWSGVVAVASVEAADALALRIRTLSDAHRGTQVERTASAYLETIAALKTVLR